MLNVFCFQKKGQAHSRSHHANTLKNIFDIVMALRKASGNSLQTLIRFYGSGLVSSDPTIAAHSCHFNIQKQISSWDVCKEICFSNAWESLRSCPEWGMGCLAQYKFSPTIWNSTRCIMSLFDGKHSRSRTRMPSCVQGTRKSIKDKIVLAKQT